MLHKTQIQNSSERHPMSRNPRFVLVRHRVGKFAWTLAAALTLGLPQAADAQVSKKSNVASLEGSWSGGGTVSFAAGGKEQARCRASFSRAGERSYTVNATCATASGKAAQTATVRQVSSNRYSGSFYNSEYSISGAIDIVVHGSSQTVRLTSDGGSGVLNLSR
jgi:hypothetical protein